MPNERKGVFLDELRTRYGALKKLDNTQSLYDVGNEACRVYVRYSKIHGRNSTFYGLRQEDLRQLEGRASVICFLWEGQTDPLLVPFADYEEVFQSLTPAGDGQYKVQVYIRIDVIWLERGAGRLHALFEVEYSTPVYSGLLRFNDILLTVPNLGARFSVVSNDERRSLFTRQLNRPTFRMSKLDEYSTFMEYASVFGWHRRLTHQQT